MVPLADLSAFVRDNLFEWRSIRISELLYAHRETARLTIPMGRFATAEECVGTVLFLATDALSSYVTGQVIEVNGGQLMP